MRTPERIGVAWTRELTQPFAAIAGALACALGLTLTSPSARAAEVQLSMGAGGGGSDWRSDGAAFGTLKVGIRGWDVIAPYFLARLGYGSVDSRLLTMVSVGVQTWTRVGPLRPYVRAGFAHQHEEPLAYVSKNPWGAAFGVGDGIRHRAGADMAVGLDWPVKKWKRWDLYLALEGTTNWFTNSQGPSWFWGGGVAVGFNYTL